MNKIGSILWGLALVCIGVIIGLNSLDITNIDIFFRGWWTLFIIVPAVIGIFKDQNKRGHVIGLIIGVLLLLSCYGLLEFEILWKLFIPIVLVVIGISIIFKDTLKKEVKEKFKKLDSGDKKEYYATFSGQNLVFKNDELENSELNAIFGSIKCNLLNSKIKEDKIISVCAIFGGVSILVPDDVDVKITSTPIFGGVSDERKNKKVESKNTIYINATCIFGGLEIK